MEDVVIFISLTSVTIGLKIGFVNTVTSYPQIPYVRPLKDPNFGSK